MKTCDDMTSATVRLCLFDARSTPHDQRKNVRCLQTPVDVGRASQCSSDVDFGDDADNLAVLTTGAPLIPLRTSRLAASWIGSLGLTITTRFVITSVTRCLFTCATFALCGETFLLSWCERELVPRAIRPATGMPNGT